MSHLNCTTLYLFHQTVKSLMSQCVVLSSLVLTMTVSGIWLFFCLRSHSEINIDILSKIDFCSKCICDVLQLLQNSEVY